MPLPDASGFPLWLQVVAAAFAGITIGIGILITRFGVLKGIRKTAEKTIPPPDPNLATEIGRLANAVERLARRRRGA